MNWITSVLLLDDYAISGSADRAVWIRPISNQSEKSFCYKHDGWVTGIEKYDDTKILTYSTDGKLILFDWSKSETLHTCSAHTGGIRVLCKNSKLLCTYSDADSLIIIRDSNTLGVIGSIENSKVPVGQARSQYNMILNEIGAMALTDSNLLIAGESKKVRIWDTRIWAKNPVEEFKHPNYSKIELPEKFTGYKPITNATKFKYVEEWKTLVANFTGGNGLNSKTPNPHLRFSNWIQYISQHNSNSSG